VQAAFPGTPTHCAPEANDHVVLRAFDSYSHAVILWELLSKQRPWITYCTTQEALKRLAAHVQSGGRLDLNVIPEALREAMPAVMWTWPWRPASVQCQSCGDLPCVGWRDAEPARWRHDDIARKSACTFARQLRDRGWCGREWLVQPSKAQQARCKACRHGRCNWLLALAACAQLMIMQLRGSVLLSQRLCTVCLQPGITTLY
jgi:hypothetical protein